MKKIIAFLALALLGGSVWAQQDTPTDPNTDTTGQVLKWNGTGWEPTASLTMIGYGFQPEPDPTSFRDTVQFYCVFVSDTSTGTTESRLVLCERTGTTESYWASAAPKLKPGQVLSTSIGYGHYWQTIKKVETRKFFYYQAPSQFGWVGSGDPFSLNLPARSPLSYSNEGHWVEIRPHRILLAVRQQQEGGMPGAIIDTQN